MKKILLVLLFFSFCASQENIKKKGDFRVLDSFILSKLRILKNTTNHSPDVSCRFTWRAESKRTFSVGEVLGSKKNFPQTDPNKNLALVTCPSKKSLTILLFSKEYSSVRFLAPDYSTNEEASVSTGSEVTIPSHIYPLRREEWIVEKPLGGQVMVFILSKAKQDFLKKILRKEPHQILYDSYATTKLKDELLEPIEKDLKKDPGSHLIEFFEYTVVDKNSTPNAGEPEESTDQLY